MDKPKVFANTINKTIEIVPQVVSLLRKMSPVWDQLQKGVRKHVI